MEAKSISRVQDFFKRTSKLGKSDFKQDNSGRAANSNFKLHWEANAMRQCIRLGYIPLAGGTAIAVLLVV